MTVPSARRWPVDGEDQGLGVAGEQGFERAGAVGGAVRVLGGELPEGQDRVEVDGGRGTEFGSRHGDDVIAPRGQPASVARDVGRREKAAGARPENVFSQSNRTPAPAISDQRSAAQVAAAARL